MSTAGAHRHCRQTTRLTRKLKQENNVFVGSDLKYAMHV
jgi:hypothetical protein